MICENYNQLLAAEARSALERGWLLTPLDGKKPVRSAWQSEPPPTLEQIDRWIKAGHNLGLRTGRASRVVVVDLDPGSDPTPLDLPPTWKVSTGRGNHLYYQLPEGVEIGNSASKLGPHIDIRGDGGQVVFPGSVHPDTGAVYRWADGQSPDDVELAELPQHIISLLTRPEKPAQPPQLPPVGNRDSESDLMHRARAYAVKVPGVSEGSRNQAAFKLGGNLGALITEAGEVLNEADVLQVVTEWNVRNTPPLPGGELRTTVHSALHNGTPRSMKSGVAGRQPAPSVKAAHSPRANDPAGPEPIDVSGLQYERFPVDCLPGPVAEFVSAVAGSVNCDESMVALPVLAVAAASIGNAREVLVKSGHVETCILWVATIVNSGDGKTPAAKPAVRPLHKRYREARRQFERKMAEYNRQVERLEADAKRGGGKGSRPSAADMPPRPSLERSLVADVTIERLAELLEENPRGLLVHIDELAGLMASFGRYQQGRGGADTAAYLSMHSGEPIVIDRKTLARHVYIARPLVSICGGIQPSAFRKAMDPELRGCGFLPRFLLASPPSRVRYAADAEIPEDVEAAYGATIDRLFNLQPGLDGDGQPRPTLVGYSPAAKPIWRRVHNQLADEAMTLPDDLRSCWSKLQAYQHRLAMVLHYLSWACGDTAGDCIGPESAEAAGRLVLWFSREARRAWGPFIEGDSRRQRVADLMRRLQGMGGKATVRDIQRTCSYDSADEAREALEGLVRCGLGAWRNESPGPQGGQPRKVLVLIDPSDTTPPQMTEPPATTPPSGLCQVSDCQSIESLR